MIKIKYEKSNPKDYKKTDKYSKEKTIKDRQSSYNYIPN